MQEEKKMLIELLAKLATIEVLEKMMEAEEATECDLIQRQIDAAKIEYKELFEKLFTLNFLHLHNKLQ